MPVTAVIPSLNEAARIAATIDAAFAAGVAEVIVADGGSSDATVEIAASRGARVITGERMRARQLNRGAAEAAHDTIVFVHADTLLPAGAAAAIESALRSAVFGGFHISFLEPRLRRTAWLINMRTRILREPWGDQAHFVRREMFLATGGYREMPIMEDYELARRMKRHGRCVVLQLAVRTSGRRFLAKGEFRTAAINWLIIAGYHLGISPERLARWYRGAS